MLFLCTSTNDVGLQERSYMVYKFFSKAVNLQHFIKDYRVTINSNLAQRPPSITTSQSKEDGQHDNLQANLPSDVSWMANALGYVAD